MGLVKARGEAKAQDVLALQPGPCRSSHFARARRPGGVGWETPKRVACHQIVRTPPN